MNRVDEWIPKGLAQNAEVAKSIKSILGRSDLVQEPKLDGFRLLTHIENGRARTFTRTGNEKTGFLPQVERELSKLPDGTWLDGEICHINADGVNGANGSSTVQTVLGRGGPDKDVTAQERRAAILTYVVFDCMAFDGLDIRSLPLHQRMTVLDNIFGEDWEMNPAFLMRAAQCPASDETHDEFVAKGFEGSIVKDPNSRYLSGKRGGGWWKIKAGDLLDCVVMGFVPGKDSFSGMVGAVRFGQYKDGVLVERGKASGMTMEVRDDMTTNPEAFIGEVVSIAHMGIMESGKVRHPQFKGMRDDKPAEDCVWTD